MKRKMIAIIFLGFATLSYGEEGKINGTVFYEFTHQFNDTLKVNNPLELQRVYLTVEKQLSSTLAYKFQTDVARGKDGWLTAYLKNARVDWKSPLGKLTFGLQGMNMFGIQEKTWGHRYLEKSTMDLNKWASSADLGVGFATSIKKIYVDTKITNGEGYKKPEANVYKKFSLQLVLGERNLSKHQDFNAGGVVSYEPIESDSKTGSTIVAGAFVGWAGAAIRTGVEANVLTSTDEKSSELLSVYATYQAIPKLSLLARWDQLDLGSKGKTYIILGMAYMPEKGLTITPNLRYEKSGDGSDLILVNVNFQFKV